MRNTLMISSILALGLGAASAQTAPATTTPAPATTAQVTQFSDVPAGHWAKDAVDRITQCGLIQGFPDGTFRGNENLTRYQAALIFHRLLTSGALSNCGLSQTDMTTVMNGMQEVAPELAAISARVTDLETANAAQAARITALEERINSAATGTDTADTAALTARIDALEAAIRNIPAGPQGPAGPAGPAGPQGPAGAAGTSATVVTPAPTTPTTTAPTTVVIGDITPDATVTNTSNLYAGVTIGAKGAASSDQCRAPFNRSSTAGTVGYCLSGGAVVGTNSVFGPIGARIAAEYQPGYNGVNADAALTYNLNTGSNLGIYAGAGLGITSSQARGTTSNTNGTGNATDVYALGLAGVEYRVTDSIAVFGEADGRYYLSNKGRGTGLAYTTNTNSTTTNTAGRGFNIGGKAGLKFYF